MTPPTPRGATRVAAGVRVVVRGVKLGEGVTASIEQDVLPGWAVVIGDHYAQVVEQEGQLYLSIGKGPQPFYGGVNSPVYLCPLAPLPEQPAF